MSGLSAYLLSSFAVSFGDEGRFYFIFFLIWICGSFFAFYLGNSVSITLLTCSLLVPILVENFAVNVIFIAQMKMSLS